MPFFRQGKTDKPISALISRSLTTSCSADLRTIHCATFNSVQDTINVFMEKRTRCYFPFLSTFGNEIQEHLNSCFVVWITFK